MYYCQSKVGMATFLILLFIKMTIRFDRKIKLFKIKLTHRLMRKLVKELKDSKVCWHWGCLRALHQYRRHPNKCRFYEELRYANWISVYSPLYKDKKYLYIWPWLYSGYKEPYRVFLKSDIVEITEKELNAVDLLKYLNVEVSKSSELLDEIPY